MEDKQPGTAIVNQATGEIVQRELPMNVDEILQQRKVITTVLRQVMIRDVHYGIIPGTGKRQSLLKPGADLLLATFHIATDPIIDDLSSHQEIRYRVKLRGLMMGSGQLVGTGIGEASSNEEKYRWRKCNRREYENSPDTMRRIKYYNDNDVQQIRANPYDQVNTILKMAKKRASVDLVMTALAAAEVFDRIDDVIKEEEARERKEPPAPDHAADRVENEGRTTKPADGAATGEIINLIRREADQAGLRDVDLFDHFKVAEWAEIQESQIPAIQAWIKEMSP